MGIVKSDKNSEAGIPPDPKLMEAVGKFSESMIKAGIVLENGSLLPSSKGARLRVAGGKITVKDGPYAEAKELIGGYAILQVKSKEEAIELSKKLLQVHIDVMGPSYECELEVREMFDPGDCGQ
jgi:hypothetical protein